jgi:CBS domain containing-hemolysin-like protein
MPDSSRPDSGNGDSDSSSGGLLGAIRRLFDNGDADTSLRAQIEEVIDDHAEEQNSGGELPEKGDLSPLELTMLRNLLHFSEHDADDIAVPRGQIVALSADAGWEEVVAAFAEHGHSRMPVYRGTLDEVIGMMHIKDVFPFLATRTDPPADWTALMRQPLYVPQARGALDVLADMRASRTHLATGRGRSARRGRSRGTPPRWPPRSARPRRS